MSAVRFPALGTATVVAALSLTISAQRSDAPAPLPRDAPFTVAINPSVLEAAPIFIAQQGSYGSRFRYISGGVRTLQNNGAHAAGNATTQMLVALRDNRNVRLLLTLADGNYRIIARRSAGISRLRDLQGKRIVLPPSTSAHYFLVAMLRTVGLQESDVTLVSAPTTAMAAAVAKHEADAISMWEPESQNALVALGNDAITFQDNTVYRELYSIYSSTDVLNDATRRRELVSFVQAITRATVDLTREPARFFPVISRITMHPEAEIARSWEHHAFGPGIAPDLLNLLVEEEKWVANRQSRPPRTRQELAAFIDTSILDEATR